MEINIKNLNNVFLIFILTIFAFHLFACSKEIQNPSITPDTNQPTASSDSNPNLHSFNLTEFKRNKDLWKTKNIKNYKMIVEARSMMYFGEQVLIEVENGTAKSLKLITDSGHINAQAYKDFDTVEKIFGVAERAAEAKAETLNIGYNDAYGYPVQVIIDVSYKIADDEMSVKIKNLEVIEEFRNQL